MRKDLRVGLGIGGVLLAVMVVFLVVKSHTKPKAVDPNTSVADKIDKPDADSTTTPDATGLTSTDPVVPPPAGPSIVTPPAAPALPEAAATAPEKSRDPFDPPSSPTPPATTSSWDKILADGNVPTPAPTVTPPAGSNRAIGDHFNTTPSSPGLTPGNIASHPIAAIETSRPPATPPVSHTSHASRTHVVAQGETLSTIAKAAYGNSKYYLQIEKANPTIVPERLRPGTTINLPELTVTEHAEHHAASHGSAASASTTAVDSARQYVVKANDSLYRISMRLYEAPNKVDAIYELNKDAIGPDRGRLKLGMILKLPTPPTSASR